jgi:DNA repair exonuclease SbcCD ATPase subunit
MRSKAEYEEIRQNKPKPKARSKCEIHGLFVSSIGGRCRLCEKAASETQEEPKAQERKEQKQKTVGRKPGRAVSIAKLESEIKKLKRENARLSKKLTRYQENDFDTQDEADEIIAGLLAQLAKFQPPDSPPLEESCPNCGAKNIISLTTPGGVLVKSCAKCRTRL